MSPTLWNKRRDQISRQFLGGWSKLVNNQAVNGDLKSSCHRLLFALTAQISTEICN